MAETKFYTEQFRVMDCDCDMNHRLTAGAFLRLAQQISTDQCESIGMNDDFTGKTTRCSCWQSRPCRWTGCPGAARC